MPKKDEKGEHMLSFSLGKIRRLGIFACNSSVSDIGAEVGLSVTDTTVAATHDYFVSEMKLEILGWISALYNDSCRGGRSNR